jgi:hypothetical protein
MCCSSQWDRINDCNFGGYLDFVGIPPFIDGRAEPYGQTYILRHDRALSLRNLPDFLRLLEEYRIGATLFAFSTPAVARRIGNASVPMTLPSCTCGAEPHQN